MIDSTKKLFRWGPLDAAVLPLGYTIEASFEMMYDLFGICWTESVIIFDRDKALWILESEKVAETSHAFTEKVILREGGDKKFYDLWNSKVAELQKIQKGIASVELAELSREELGKLFLRWSQTYLKFWAIGMIAELINYSLESRLKEILKKKLSDERDINEAFALLSTPTKLSFYKEEEIDLMKIALLDGPKRQERLKAHQQNYFWMYNNYLEAKALDVEYFADQIKHTTAKDAKKFLEEFGHYAANIDRQKQNCTEKLSFSADESRIVRYLNESIIFQDDRKKYNLIAEHYLEEFLKELGKRVGRAVSDLKWLMPEEIEAAMMGAGLGNIIEQRKYITVVSRALGQKNIQVRNMASKIERSFNKAEFEKSATVQGTVASTSSNRYFRGVARIVLSPKKGDKLKPGEILVTTMTTPDFVVFMKRAGAIITDVGGVTCHAAIVSREFGLPCIVGTENATKVIKDGDILELHNLRGTVKIVSAN